MVSKNNCVIDAVFSTTEYLIDVLRECMICDGWTKAGLGLYIYLHYCTLPATRLDCEQSIVSSMRKNMRFFVSLVFWLNHKRFEMILSDEPSDRNPFVQTFSSFRMTNVREMVFFFLCKEKIYFRGQLENKFLFIVGEFSWRKSGKTAHKNFIEKIFYLFGFKKLKI